jgi:hypothetical protein
MLDADRFAVLHAVRVSGLADGERLARATGLEPTRVVETAAALVEAELLGRRDLPRGGGWIVTAAGGARDREELGERLDSGARAAVGEGYEGLLRINASFKELCTVWQSAASAAGGDARDAFASELAELGGDAGEAADRAAIGAPWFGFYRRRIEAACEGFAAGDDRLLLSPSVDSVHTVWAESHEDFLVTLGRERSAVDE